MSSLLLTLYNIIQCIFYLSLSLSLSLSHSVSIFSFVLLNCLTIDFESNKPCPNICYEISISFYRTILVTFLLPNNYNNNNNHKKNNAKKTIINEFYFLFPKYVIIFEYQIWFGWNGREYPSIIIFHTERKKRFQFFCIFNL